jgi:hypothetical protein
MLVEISIEFLNSKTSKMFKLVNRDPLELQSSKAGFVYGSQVTVLAPLVSAVAALEPRLVEMVNFTSCSDECVGQ